ncbi:tyrosine-protein phosphatase [Sphingomonas sp. DT-204]|uniref:tyrosine-protein phosphatase n=1 Tax=Sphingomonas sp. DT-204 TaxID=3396166 RepID=UPI003F1B6B49
MRKTILAGTFGGLAALASLGISALHGEMPAPRQAQVQAQSKHSRALPLQGGQNFRDLGGYRTRDGRTVRWGLLYRSGAMNGLTEADFAYLDRIGIRTVCDFRSTDERKAAPVRWPDGKAPKVFADDYKLDMGGLDFRAAKSWNGDQAHRMMASLYPRLLEQFNGQYRRMFEQFLAGNVPLAFNCSAGKDRTGVAAALILTALDVPRETVIQDYLLSNRHFDPRRAVTADDSVSQGWKQLPPPVLQAFMGVDRSYIEAVFRVIDAYPGGPEAYLRDKLGLSGADLVALRRRFTEK